MLESIAAYFEGIPSSHRTLLLVGGIVLFWLIEGLIPLRKKGDGTYRHAGINLFFTLTTAIANLSFAFLIVMASDYMVSQQLGLLYILDMSLLWKLILAMLLMDLVGAYLVHWTEHKVHWMWKFHIIHHSDTTIDTTSALRHHPGESVFRALFTLLAVLLTGAPIWMIMVYQSMSALLSQFNHASISLPAWLDRPLRWIIITPGMHHVHHHESLPYTDANYGNIFSFWDRLFGTYLELAPEEIKYGLDLFNKREGHLGDLLNLPFNGHTYKQKSDGEGYKTQ